LEIEEADHAHLCQVWQPIEFCNKDDVFAKCVKVYYDLFQLREKKASLKFQLLDFFRTNNHMQKT